MLRTADCGTNRAQPMTVRQWTSENIDADKTYRRATASVIKYVSEGLLAVFLGGAVSLLLLALLLVRDAPLPLGVAGAVGLWFVLSSLVFIYYTTGTYTDID